MNRPRPDILIDGNWINALIGFAYASRVFHPKDTPQMMPCPHCGQYLCGVALTSNRVITQPMHGAVEDCDGVRAFGVEPKGLPRITKDGASIWRCNFCGANVRLFCPKRTKRK
jgi:hypothetical protein